MAAARLIVTIEIDIVVAVRSLVAVLVTQETLQGVHLNIENTQKSKSKLKNALWFEKMFPAYI